MPICPKCNAEIEHLNFSAKVETWGNVYLDKGIWKDKKGKKHMTLDWDKRNYGDWEDIKISCPKCDNKLDFDTEEIIGFLNNEDELQALVKKKLNQTKNRVKRR